MSEEPPPHQNGGTAFLSAIATLPPTEVAFLGFAERATLAQEGGTPFRKWNIIGLKHTLPTFIVPLMLTHLKWAVAWRLGSETAVELRIKSDTGELVGSINIKLPAFTERNPSAEIPASPTDQGLLFDPQAWTIMLLEPGPPQLVILRPGRHSIMKVQADGSEVVVGNFDVALLDALPLDADRIAAIRSDPRASKAVRIELHCGKCLTKVRAFAALDKKPEADGFLWYQDLPDEMICLCGSIKWDLRSIKRNLHGLLGRAVSPVATEVSVVPLYEQGALQEIRLNFVRLLDRNPAEELLQKFIEVHPILLHQFPAEKLFFKPAILAYFKADFAVLTSQKELMLIEIENTKTRLLKKMVMLPDHLIIPLIRCVTGSTLSMNIG